MALRKRSADDSVTAPEPKVAEPLNESAAAAETTQDGGGASIYLDPDLEKLRDEDAARLAEVPVTPHRDEPSLDDDLVAARDAEAERLAAVEVDLTPREALLDPELERVRDAEMARNSSS